jgi:hypothetical protein
MKHLRWFLIAIGLILVVGALAAHLALALGIGLIVVAVQVRQFFKENPLDDD